MGVEPWKAEIFLNVFPSKEQKEVDQYKKAIPTQKLFVAKKVN